jgi:hypothetical protein
VKVGSSGNRKCEEQKEQEVRGTGSVRRRKFEEQEV